MKISFCWLQAVEVVYILIDESKWIKNSLAYLLQFLIVLMAVTVALGFLFEVFLEGFGEVNARLIGEADDYKKHIGQFIA